MFDHEAKKQLEADEELFNIEAKLSKTVCMDIVVNQCGCRSVHAVSTYGFVDIWVGR